MIYKKKNTQALVEMETIENAEKFRKNYMHIINSKSLRIKVQYTTKKFLIVNKNSVFECDVRKKQNGLVNNNNSPLLNQNLNSGTNQRELEQLPQTQSQLYNTWNSNLSEYEKKSLDSDLSTNITNNMTTSGTLLSSSLDFQQFNFNNSYRNNISGGSAVIKNLMANNKTTNYRNKMSLKEKELPPNMGQNLISALQSGFKNSFIPTTPPVNNQKNCMLSYSMPLPPNSNEAKLIQKKSFQCADNYYEPERGILVSYVPSFATHDMIFNLFSLYGNIERIDKNTNLGLCGVIYQSPGQMNMALKNLHKLPLFGNPIHLDV